MAGSTPISNDSELVSTIEIAPEKNEPEAADASQTDLWIFRDGRKLICGPELVADLARRIAQPSGDHRILLDSLIQAGQLEAALADADSASTKIAEQLTELLACAVCAGGSLPDGRVLTEEALMLLQRIEAPANISISPPEGFTYYALHPLDFANVISVVAAEPAACAVIGIRSIGTTLSAMCVAGLRDAGREALRTTLRPTGHPYARNTKFRPDQMNWIREQMGRDAQFLIVDEGPGRSGSTFLSVAEALLRAGVPDKKITIIGSRTPDPDELCAEDAGRRWKQFRFIATTPSTNLRFQNCTYAGGGRWREIVCGKAAPWPASWLQMERLKFLTSDGKRLFKFEGMGPLGAETRERAFVLAEAGFSPRAEDAGDGFLDYEWIAGRPGDRDDLDTGLLERMAEYCAFRVAHFAAPSSDGSELRQMLAFNVQTEFGMDVALPEDAFATESPVLVDGRMQPYEWVTANGSFLKTDSISHGDDHFFPGPCDIAWDLAGIAVEWELDQDARNYLQNSLLRTTGKPLNSDLPLYMLAYSVFRTGFCKMAISTVRGSEEEGRLKSACEYYRMRAKELVNIFSELRNRQVA